MPDPSTVLKNAAAVSVGSLAAGIGYASLIERNAFVMSEVTMPVLTPGSTPFCASLRSGEGARPSCA